MSSPAMRAIAERVAAEHGLTLADLIGRSRSPAIVRARQTAIHACWMERRWSLHQLGGFFKRDHTTILYAARKIDGEPKPLDFEDAA